MAHTNGNGGAPGAPAGIHKWSWLIALVVGLLLQTGVLIAVVSGWRAATDERMGELTRRTLDLERLEREASNVPGRLDQHQERITKLEARDEEARRLDRTTTTALATLNSEVRNVAEQVKQVAQDVRELRNERRQTGQYSMPPAPPPSSPASQRPGDRLPGFRP